MEDVDEAHDNEDDDDEPHPEDTDGTDDNPDGEGDGDVICRWGNGPDRTYGEYAWDTQT